MNNWFEYTVKLNKINEQSGRDKKVTEKYLIDAISFGDGEKRIYEELEKYISGEFLLTHVTKAKYTDIFHFDTGGRWYKAKVSYVSVDEEAGKEKKVSNMILVMGTTVKEAYDNLNQSLSGMTVDFDIISISESPIVVIFPYFQDDHTVEHDSIEGETFG